MRWPTAPRSATACWCRSRRRDRALWTTVTASGCCYLTSDRERLWPTHASSAPTGSRTLARPERNSIGGCGFPLGAAPRHGRVLRVRRAAHPAHPARPARAGRRIGWTWCGGWCQLRVAGVRGPVGDAHAPSASVDRCDGGRAAAARCGVRRRQPAGLPHRARHAARRRAAVFRRGVRGAGGTGARPRPRSRSSVRSCGNECARRPV